ncbi:MAG TPA: gluconate 2-dehydrogenase subunit 3 family protein [Gemmatimonadales bacterium]|nr:gluconate 2-dehydrogenase subunit 3 family protein [Gemmatimonadales bacterium]
MSALDRRRFLQAIATAVPAGATLGTVQACSPAPVSSALDGDTLDALAEIVLPGELGPEGRSRAVAAFRGWLADYQPASELNHGYGTAALEYAPAHPSPGWAAQLEALDLESQQRYGVAFARLDRDQRTSMVRVAIERDRSATLGDPAGARHVAVGLLAHFSASPQAANLCYRAAIDSYRCRPLADVTRRPSAPAS